MEKKMTKKEMFAEIIAMAQGSPVGVSAKEIVEFAEHEIELLTRKSSSKSKAEKEKDLVNEKLMGCILSVLKVSAEPITASEIMKSDVELSKYPIQKITALLKKLVDSEQIQKSVDKRKSVFYI